MGKCKFRSKIDFSTLKFDFLTKLLKKKFQDRIFDDFFSKSRKSWYLPFLIAKTKNPMAIKIEFWQNFKIVSHAHDRLYWLAPMSKKHPLNTAFICSNLNSIWETFLQIVFAQVTVVHQTSRCRLRLFEKSTWESSSVDFWFWRALECAPAFKQKYCWKNS